MDPSRSHRLVYVINNCEEPRTIQNKCNHTRDIKSGKIIIPRSVSRICCYLEDETEIIHISLKAGIMLFILNASHHEQIFFI